MVTKTRAIEEMQKAAKAIRGHADSQEADSAGMMAGEIARAIANTWDSCADLVRKIDRLD